MLSLDRCRALIGADAEEWPDEKLEQVRESLYQLAHIVIAGYEKQSQPEIPSDSTEKFEDFLSRIPADKRREVEESAARKHKHDGLSRDEAERAAITEYIERQRN